MPAATPVISPAASTVAIAALEVVQAPPASPSEANVVVAPTQIFWVPVILPASGAVVIVTVLVAVAFAQPPMPVTV